MRRTAVFWALPILMLVCISGCRQPRTACGCGEALFGKLAEIDALWDQFSATLPGELPAGLEEKEAETRDLIQYCRPIMDRDSCETSILEFAEKYQVSLWDCGEFVTEMWFGPPEKVESPINKNDSAEVQSLLNYLKREQYADSLNAFPVSSGDTGKFFPRMYRDSVQFEQE